MKNSPLQPFKLQLRWIEPWWSIDMEICTILSQVWRLWFKFEWSLFNWNTDNSAAVDIPYCRNHQDNRTLTNVHVTCKLMLYTSVPYFSFKIIHSNMLFIFFCFCTVAVAAIRNIDKIRGNTWVEEQYLQYITDLSMWTEMCLGLKIERGPLIVLVVVKGNSWKKKYTKRNELITTVLNKDAPKAML